MSRFMGRLFRRAETAPDTTAMLPGVRPPSRVGSDDSPLGMGAVFRGVQVLTTAASQISFDVYRGGQALKIQPALIRRPDLEISRSQWIAEAVISMALNGNCFLKATRAPDRSILALEVLAADRVWVTKNERGKIAYGYSGKELDAADVLHIKFLPVPGQLRGLGPISQARVELAGFRDLRDFSADTFARQDVPSGILKSDQKINGEIAAETKKRWEETHDGKVRVLGSGLDYQRIPLSAKDAQYVESRQLSVTDIARLLGLPSSLMLATQANTSTTYQNVEQEWIGFVRFTLMAYLRPIEEALTDAIGVNGQTVRFNLEALLRTDTATRYAGYAVGITNGFLTPDEARVHENLAPLGRHAAPVKEIQS